MSGARISISLPSGLARSARAFVLGGALGACGSEGPAAAPEDAGGAPDSAAAEDGGTADAADAGTSRPEAGTSARFCASKGAVAFCDDFDDGDLENDWTTTTAVPPERTLLDLALEHVSPPYAMYAGIGALGKGVQANANVRRTVPGAFSRATLSFSIKLSATDMGEGSLALATIDVSDSHFFTLHLRDTDPNAPGPSLEETRGAQNVRNRLSAVPAEGVWTRIAIDVDLAGGKASVSFDGKKVLDAAPIVVDPGTEATVRVGGLYAIGPTPKLEILVDDVLLETSK